MVHECQRLPLGLETGDNGLGIHAQLDDLERDTASNGFFLLGHVNHATTAFTDLLKEFVAADAVARFLGYRNHASGDYEGFGGYGRRRFIQELARSFMRLKQILDALAKLSVAGAFAVEKGGALGSGLFKCQRKQGFFTRGIHSSLLSCASVVLISSHEGARQIWR